MLSPENLEFARQTKTPPICNFPICHYTSPLAKSQFFCCIPTEINFQITEKAEYCRHGQEQHSSTSLRKSRRPRSTMGTFAASRKPSESWCRAAPVRVQEREPDPSLGGNARVKECLKEKFQIAHIPCCFWLLTLLKMVKPDTLNECMMKWALQFMPENRKGTTISPDGKTIRSTVGKKSMDSPRHIISAQICEIGVTPTFRSRRRQEQRNPGGAVRRPAGCKIKKSEFLSGSDVPRCLTLSEMRIFGIPGTFCLKLYPEIKSVSFDYRGTIGANIPGMSR